MSVTQSTTTHQQAPDAMRVAYGEAAAAWPKISLSFEQFRSAAIRWKNADIAPAYPADVFLCAACAVGSRGAYQALEKAHFPVLRTPIGWIVGDSVGVDDVLQEVRTRLFVGDSPRIMTYRGDGPLAGWLRRVALRIAQDQRRTRVLERERQRKLACAQLWMAASTTPAPEFPEAVGQLARLCESAWREAIGSLNSMDRCLLYYNCICGISIDTLAPLYCKHRATIARHIGDAKDRVRRLVREILAAQTGRLGAGEPEAWMLQGQWEPELSAALFGAVPEASAA